MATHNVSGEPEESNTPVRRQGNHKRMITFSTATLPGLIQAYARAGEVLPFFNPHPDKLRAALEDATTRESTIFMLQRGATALNALDCLAEGTPESLAYMQTLLHGLIGDLYRKAETP